MEHMNQYLNQNDRGESVRVYTMVPETKVVRCIRLDEIPKTTAMMDREFEAGARMFTTYKRVDGKWEFGGGAGWNLVEYAIEEGSTITYVDWEEPAA